MAFILTLREKRFSVSHVGTEKDKKVKKCADSEDSSSIQRKCQGVLYLLPVKAIQRAYLVASRRQCDATRRPQVTVREMMPMMMKKSVVTHSGGSRGGMQVRSRPWMVWHCRMRPTVRAPVKRWDESEMSCRLTFIHHLYQKSWSKTKNSSPKAL